MPIDYKKYPENWKSEIRPRILERAKDNCECCGLPNGSVVWSFRHEGETKWTLTHPSVDLETCNIPSKMVKVILTIAHLDHDETNKEVKDERLKAMCQLCHLRYDAEEKKRRRSLK